MKLGDLKTNQKLQSRLMFGLAGLLLLAVVTKVAASRISVAQLPSKIERATEQNNLDDETVKKHLSGGKEAAEKLKKKNAFVPPPAKPKQPVCTGIFGDMAIFGNKGYKVGEEVSGAKIVSIGGNVVVVDWEDKKVELRPFAIANAQGGGSSSGRPSRRPSSRSGESKRPEQPRPTMGNRPPEGRFNISDEQRQRMMEMRQRYENSSPEERERMREEFMRRRGGGPGGGPPGGGDRGGDRGGRGGDRGGDGGGRGGRGR